MNQLVEQYEIDLQFKYEKELQAQGNSLKKDVVCSIDFKWDFLLQPIILDLLTMSL